MPYNHIKEKRIYSCYSCLLLATPIGRGRGRTKRFTSYAQKKVLYDDFDSVR